MTTHRMHLALAAAVLLTATACQQAAPNNPPASSASSAAPASTPTSTATPAAAPGGGATPPQTINVGLHFDENANGMCTGALGSQSQYSAKVRRGWKIHWAITNDCATFDYTKACAEFTSTDKVLNGGSHQCGKASSMAIDAVVTSVPGDAPDNSTHLYSIRYDARAGGDPEIVVLCDTCDEQ